MSLLLFSEKDVENNDVFKCALCKAKIDKDDIEKVFRCSIGSINHDLLKFKAFYEVKNSVFLHPDCLELMLESNFKTMWKRVFDSSL